MVSADMSETCDASLFFVSFFFSEPECILSWVRVIYVLRILTIPDEEGTLEFPLLSPHEMTVQSGASLAYLSLTDHALTPSEETIMKEGVERHGGALVTLSGNDEALNARVLCLMIDDMGFQHAHTVFADHLKKPNAPSPSMT